LDYDVAFLPTLQREADPAVDALRRMGVTVPLARDFAEPWQFIRDHGATFDLAMLCRVTVACHLIDPMRTFAPKTTVIFDTVDLHFLREERAATLVQSDELKDQAARTRIEELRVMDLADVTMVRSKVEAALLAEIASSVRTRIVPIVRPVDGRLSPVEDRRDMMFVGGFLHQPNLDAFEFLHAEIWPRIRAQLPDARLHIIGSSAPASVTNLHDPKNGFMIEGYVADLDEYYRSIRVNLAPLRYGAGLKGKLVASLAKGVPSVATDLAAEGMDLENMTNVLLASDAEAFADAAVRVYTDDWLWNRLSNEGVACAEARFSVEAVHANLESLLKELEKR
jgi:glycosyltransferase involved in cell wall biosynthesis